MVNEEKTMMKNNEYATVKIPRSLIKVVDKLIGKHGFTSRAEITKQAVRELLQEYKPTRKKRRVEG